MQLHSVSTHAFMSLHNLHSLVLSHNDLEAIHHETLTGLSVLNSLAIDHNKLHTLHAMALKNCSVLEEIRLNSNILTQVWFCSIIYSKVTKTLKIRTHARTHARTHQPA